MVGMNRTMDMPKSQTTLCYAKLPFCPRCFCIRYIAAPLYNVCTCPIRTMLRVANPAPDTKHPTQSPPRSQSHRACPQAEDPPPSPTGPCSINHSITLS